MSLNEKLKEILEKVRNSKSTEAAEELQELLMYCDDAPPLSEQIKSEQTIDEEEIEIVDLVPPPLPEAPAPSEPPQEVELEWDQVVPVLQLQQNMKTIRENIGALCVNFEAEKAKMIQALAATQAQVVTEVEELRTAASLPSNVDYVLNLPSLPGEKGSFVKAQTN